MEGSRNSSVTERDPLHADDAAEIHVPVASESADAADAVPPLFYKHFRVNAQAGRKLGTTDGGALRASRIKVWVDDISWQYATTGPRIESPSGNGEPTDENWQFPGFPQFSIVLFQPQPQGIVFAVKADSAASAQEFVLDSSLDILINVNDTKSNYGDNGGAYSLHLEVLQP